MPALVLGKAQGLHKVMELAALASSELVLELGRELWQAPERQEQGLALSPPRCSLLLARGPE